MNRFLLCAFFSFYIAVSTFDLQGEDTPGSRTFTEKDAQNLYESLDETNKAKWRSIEARKQDVTIGLFSPIVFYGKVVDQNGDPVPNLRVSLTVETFTPNPLALYTARKKEKLHTDSDGLFCYKGMGRQISVFIWPPDGYDHTDDSSSRVFFYGQTIGKSVKKFHEPDKDNPVIFRLRKKEPAVLSFKCLQELLGMKPDKDYYGDMFYKQRGNAKATLDDYSRVEPDLFYPQVKVHQTYRKESENTHIFSLNVEFLGNFQIQKGERDPLVVPEDGYAGKKFSATYKIILDPTPPRNHKEFLLSADGKEWRPCKGSVLPLYAKTDNNFYGYISLHWRPRRYLTGPGIELAIKYRFNSVPDHRAFEDETELRRKLKPGWGKELRKKMVDELFNGAKSLSEILESEKSEPPQNEK